MRPENKFKSGAMSNFLLEFPIVEEINLICCQLESNGMSDATNINCCPRPTERNPDFDGFAFSAVKSCLFEIKTKLPWALFSILSPFTPLSLRSQW